MLKVGELARRAGLTVRALHHYDSIGLLTPSARSAAGYRLYDRADVARLQQIQALRRLGMELASIGAYLDRADVSPLAIVSRQLALLDRQIADATAMRAQLTVLQGQLARGETPALDTWLTTLEQMTMYEKYFSKEDLQRLPLLGNSDATADWQQLVGDVDALMNDGAAVDDVRVRALALRWMALLERDTAGDAGLLLQLDTMHRNEPTLQRDTGIAPAMRGFMMAAIGEVKLEAYGRHLTADELARMRLHQRSRGLEWPPLFEELRTQMAREPSPHTPAAAALAARYRVLFEDMVGLEADTVVRFRQAIESEPLLRVGRAMTDAMLAWLRAAQASGA
ncbi:MerR family transcriptional regulator [Massilia sp. PWRC2]|uniref:MerR family transcriptional regulator n=1 Tax=Massilia sp. PWRC2 TaxID=2804626 RepID=UPI003CF6C740